MHKKIINLLVVLMISGGASEVLGAQEKPSVDDTSIEIQTSTIVIKNEAQEKETTNNDEVTLASSKIREPKEEKGAKEAKDNDGATNNKNDKSLSQAKSQASSKENKQKPQEDAQNPNNLNSNANKDLAKDTQEKPFFVDVNSKCVLAPFPIDIEVPKLTIPKVDLTSIRETIEVKKGEDTYSLVHSIMPKDEPRINQNQVLAAIIRENPSSFNSQGPIAGKSIKVPSNERILLEDEKVGLALFEKIKSRSLNPNKLPSLYLPWVDEERRVSDAQARKDKREEKVNKIKDAYNACLQKEEDARREEERKIEEEKRKEYTEASLDEEEFMIQDEEEETIVYNDEGKRVIKLKDTSTNSNDDSDDNSLNAKNDNQNLGNSDNQNNTQSQNLASTQNQGIEVRRNQNGVISGASMSFGGSDGIKGNFTSKEGNKFLKLQEENANLALQQAKENAQLQEKIKEQQAQIDMMRAELQRSNETQQATLELLKNLNKNMNNLASNAQGKNQDENSSFVVVSCISILLILALGGAGLFFVRKNRIKLRKFLNDENNELGETNDNESLNDASLDNSDSETNSLENPPKISKRKKIKDLIKKISHKKDNSTNKS